MYCPKCGTKNNDDSVFCYKCGATLTVAAHGNQSDANDAINANAEKSNVGGSDDTGNTDDIGLAIKKKYREFSEYVGADVNIKLKISDFFSNVWRRHERSERDRLFMAGLEGATFEESSDSRTWARPWLYSRFFVVLVATYALLLVCADFFQNTNMLPGLMFIGSFVMPCTLLVFFWEMNLPRNISFYELLVIFFIGGVLSLLMTLALFDFVGFNAENRLWAIMVGIVEEAGKILACYVFLRKYKTKYILNGILIGAAVGAGFSVFESAGYALNYSIKPLLMGGDYVSAINEIIVLRGFFSGGGHISWAAITSGAMVLTSPDRCASTKVFKSGKCWVLFIIPVVLHSVWDMNFQLLGSPYLKPVLLSIISLFITFTLIRSGFAQLMREREENHKNKANVSVPAESLAGTEKG